MKINMTKLAGGFALAAVVALGTGFASKIVINPQIELSQNAYSIEVPETISAAETAVKAPAVPAVAEITKVVIAGATEAITEKVEAAVETTTEIVAVEPIIAAEPTFKDLLAAADLKKGKKAAKACSACHTFDNGGKKKTGPNLFGIVDKDVAANADFKYSKAMTAFGGTWTVERLDEYLTKPKKLVPGTKMSYAGLKKAEKRAALIAWLQTQK